MIAFKHIDEREPYVEIVLYNVNIQEIIKEYNEAVILTQKRLKEKKLYPIEEKDIEINSVNIFDSRVDNDKSSIAGMIIIDNYKKYGLCACIRIERIYASNKKLSFGQYIEEFFDTFTLSHLSCDYNSISKFAHYLLFKDRTVKLNNKLKLLLGKRVGKVGFKKDVDVILGFAIGKFKINFDYSYDKQSDKVSIFIYNSNTGLSYSERIETKRVPTSKKIKKMLSEVIDDMIIQSEKNDPDDILDLLIFKESYLS